MPPDDALLAAEKFRGELLKREREAAVRLVNAYGGVYERLQGQIKALIVELDALAAEGEVPAWKVGKLSRLKALKRQVEVEVSRYAAVAENEISQGAKGAIAQAQADAKALAQASLPGVKPLDAQIMGLWQRLDPTAVEELLGFLADDSPLMAGLRTELGPAVANGVGEKLVQGIALGYNPRKTANIIRKELGQGLTWSLRTARTAQLYAYREASRAAYVANPQIVKGWVWRSARDSRCCMSCLAMDGTVHGPDETLNDHHNGRCLAPGTVVESPSAIMAFVSRRYDGDMITIRTASGQLLSVTPNHPILTDSGWVAAGLLMKGDHVIRYLGAQGATAGVRPDKNHMPTRVEDVARALGMRRLASVPTAAEDFHGDGKGSDVYVIWADCLLCGRKYATFDHPISKQNFGGRATVESGLSCFSPCCALTQWHYAASASGLCLKHDQPVLVGASLAGHQTVSISDVAHVNATLMQAVLDHPATDVEMHSEPLLGLTGKVTLDEIINIELNPFHGPVYNLQTEYGWYSASNIVTHNCAMIPLTPSYKDLGLDVPEPKSLRKEDSGQDWFKGQPEATQRAMMGKAKHAAWKAGKFEFERLSVESKDAVWGKMRSEAPLKSLIEQAA